MSTLLSYPDCNELKRDQKSALSTISSHHTERGLDWKTTALPGWLFFNEITMNIRVKRTQHHYLTTSIYFRLRFQGLMVSMRSSSICMKHLFEFRATPS
mmetsp:Transcript_11460/g.15861  ORF Transcript_11460/g.15861 Transcript_11460/m.15861 type:complete len:99 (+) Transcript_11460:192-488(+)